MLQSLAPARTCGALEACLNPENLSFFADLYATSDAELCANAPHRPEDVEAYEAARAANRACWERKAVDDPEGLERAIVHAIIGERPLHDAQRDILDHLRAGRSVLGVMATGRGKSLTFQVHAAERALAHHEASLFVYPLRALIADQAFHLREALDAFGIGVITLTGESTPDERRQGFAGLADGTYDITLTGESTPDERRQGFAGLADGTYDIALTTPEFLAWHADEFAGTGRVKFVGGGRGAPRGLAKAGQRVAYATIGAAIASSSRGTPTSSPARAA
ncbi:DEAD/DEAH box helicase [Eggerthella sinensis]|uniref:DEAD/DEAH box helicase n=1 Tax=Eggerthella sinensis TaxID=242230 RepID=UPI0022DFCE51|nr:DEAD/DEAH box helicase [Eggerthella sinensis]